MIAVQGRQAVDRAIVSITAASQNGKGLTDEVD